jgi:hypothetical protein
MPAPKIDVPTLRRMAARRLSAAVICKAFGVSRQAVSMACLRHNICVPDGRMKPKREPQPTRWRCARCGGQRDTTQPHACRPAEPLSMGLQWERRA